MDLLLPLLCLLAGVLIGWLLQKLNSKNGLSFEQVAQQYIAKSTYEQLQSTLQDREQRLQAENAQVIALHRELASNRQLIESYKEKLETQVQELKSTRSYFVAQFEHIAAQLLEEKSEKFAAHNQKQVDQLLKPLSERLANFSLQLQTAHTDETKQRTALTEQVRHLYQLNQQMSRDAQNLTKALIGNNKTQGNWGEMVLERVLEKSGLQKGREYKIQETLRSAEGEMLRPDVILYLPDNKHLVIDAKVSLTAYEQWCSCEDEAMKAPFMQAHLLSLKQHIKGLSGKSYQRIDSMNSPDFVLMFIPIEAALFLALQTDQELFEIALHANIVLVTPTTLLATTRTVANFWQMEKRNKNAQEIAAMGGELYDKLVDFVKEMEGVGTKINTLNDSYQKAFKRLTTGRGNLIRKAEQLQSLGIHNTKTPSPLLLERALFDADEPLPAPRDDAKEENND